MRFLPLLVVLLAFVAACGPSSESSSDEALLAEAHQADCEMACSNLGECGQVNDVICTTECVLELQYHEIGDCTECISDNWAAESCDPCLGACDLLLD